MRHHFPYYIRIVSQFIIFSVCKLFVTHGKQAINIPETHKAQRTIIATNHHNMLDPFAIISSLRYRDFFRLRPIAFMTASYFFRIPWLRPLLWLAGCFPAHPMPNSNRLAGIEASIDFLDQGYTLFMFPEGKRVKDERVPAKRGITEILNLSPTSHLVLAYIRWTPGYKKIESIRYGELLEHPNDPQKILDKIYGL